jgi:hypothetical protein
MKKFFYSVEDKDFNNSHEYLDEGPAKFNVDRTHHYWFEDLAEQMARDYNDYHDGWELKDWPYVFHIWDENENYMGAVNVHMEYLPSYSGIMVNE